MRQLMVVLHHHVQEMPSISSILKISTSPREVKMDERESIIKSEVEWNIDQGTWPPQERSSKDLGKRGSAMRASAKTLVEMEIFRKISIILKLEGLSFFHGAFFVGLLKVKGKGWFSLMTPATNGTPIWSSVRPTGGSDVFVLGCMYPFVTSGFIFLSLEEKKFEMLAIGRWTSFCSAISDETAGVEELILTLETMAWLVIDQTLDCSRDF
ncbi:hypothetical protein Tco_0379592 [Tanacetum coccineum]